MMIKPTTPKIYTPQDKSCVLNLDARDVRGSKIYDRSGKGNHGAITGAVLKPGNYGVPILKFDGVDDYINISDSDDLDSSGKFIISCLVKFSAVPSDSGGNVVYMFSKNHSIAPWTAFSLRLSETAGANQDKVLFVLVDGGSNYNECFSDEKLVINEWYHIVAYFDGTNIVIYVNGKKNTPVAVTAPGSFFNSDGDVVLCSGWDGTAGMNKFLNGYLNNICINKDRSLLSSEVSQQLNDLKHLYGM